MRMMLKIMIKMKQMIIIEKILNNYKIILNIFIKNSMINKIQQCNLKEDFIIRNNYKIKIKNQEITCYHQIWIN